MATRPTAKPDEIQKKIPQFSKLGIGDDLGNIVLSVIRGYSCLSGSYVKGEASLRTTPRLVRNEVFCSARLPGSFSPGKIKVIRAAEFSYIF